MCTTTKKMSHRSDWWTLLVYRSSLTTIRESSTARLVFWQNIGKGRGIELEYGDETTCSKRFVEIVRRERREGWEGSNNWLKGDSGSGEYHSEG